MTTNTNDPDQLRAEIANTRANLSESVNALGEAGYRPLGGSKAAAFAFEYFGTRFSAA